MIDNREEFCWRTAWRSHCRLTFVLKRESFGLSESSIATGGINAPTDAYC
jgi:hypothetical protein